MRAQHQKQHVDYLLDGAGGQEQTNGKQHALLPLYIGLSINTVAKIAKAENVNGTLYLDMVVNKAYW